jgi:peroxiredoxin
MRNYCLLFDTNGNFHIDNVPPGTYDLNIHPTDPNDDEYNYRQIGSLYKQITVPDGPADQPFDSGTHELHIRRSLRIGQKAPSLETQSLDGKAIKLQDFKGKYVLLDFCAKWAGMNSSQITNLKSIYDSYGKDGRLAIISLSVDYDEKQAREMVTDSKVPWPVCYLGQMGQTQVPAMFGVEGIPHAILISPDGMIVSKNLQGTYMKNTVKKAVESKTVTAKNTP